MLYNISMVIRNNHDACHRCILTISPLTKYQIACTKCHQLMHVQCTNLSKNCFRVMSSVGDVNSWMCSSCIELYPFYELDDSSFQNCILNTDDLKNLYSDKFLFNPFDMNNEESSFSTMIDNDPDSHYFNDSKIITDTKYYDATILLILIIFCKH